MKQFHLTNLILASSLVVAVASSAHAQILHDHLSCYKIKDGKVLGDDGKKLEVDFNLSALQDPEFPQEPNCSLKVKAKKLCIPVSKAVDSTNGTPIELNGAGLANSFLCYKAKCERDSDVDPPLPNSFTITDQFAARGLNRQQLKVSEVCAPATTRVCPAGTAVINDFCAALTQNVGESCTTACDDVGLVCDAARLNDVLGAGAPSRDACGDAFKGLGIGGKVNDRVCDGSVGDIGCSVFAEDIYRCINGETTCEATNFSGQRMCACIDPP